MNRCHWCTNDPDYIHYHDNEWGVASYDAHHLFEMLILEGFQAGLSWLSILKKRARFNQVFFDFDPAAVARMNDADLEQLMLDPGIIRNRRKLWAARSNAQAWQ